MSSESTEEPTPKRLKVETVDDDSAASESKTPCPQLARCKPPAHPIELPTDVWSHVCHFLPYSDVKHVAAVNKTMLDQVMPSILRVYLFVPQELNVRHAKRLPNVERVYICCLLKNKTPHPSLFSYSGWSLEYENETKHRVVPYIAAFSKLTYVFLGGLTVWQGQTRTVWNGRTNVTTKIQQACVGVQDRCAHGHSALVHAVCGALAARAISTSTMEGLFHAQAPRFCPNTLSRSPCRVCQPVLQHFPSSWLIQIPNKFLCTSSKDRLERVVQRGDERLLTDPGYVENLIEKAFHDRSVGRSRHLLSFHGHQDLKALHELEVLNVKTVDPTIFYKAMRSYTTKDSASVNPSDLQPTVHFCPEDFDKLVELGIPLDQAVLLKDYGVKLHTRGPSAAAREGFLFGGGRRPAGMPGFMFGPPRPEERPDDNMPDLHHMPDLHFRIEGPFDAAAAGGGAGGPRGEMDPLYANIFDRVRAVVRERFGEDMGRQFGQQLGGGGNNNNNNNNNNEEEQGDDDEWEIMNVMPPLVPIHGEAAAPNANALPDPREAAREAAREAVAAVAARFRNAGARAAGADAPAADHAHRFIFPPFEHMIQAGGGVIMGGIVGMGGIPPMMPDMPPLMPRRPERNNNNNNNNNP